MESRGTQKGSGVAAALYSQFYRTGSWAPENLGLGRESCELWSRLCSPEVPLKPEAVQEDSPEEGSGAKKVLFRLADGNSVETVLVPMTTSEGDRGTLCLSSQVGCSMGCAFCETGKGGLVRSLSTEEIVGQVFAARFTLGWEFSSLVFMGMGEPLDNLEALIPALKILADPRGFAFAQEKITVCTVGLAEGITTLANLGWKKMGLSLSLNAGRQALRESIMPAGRLHTLDRLAPVLASYPQRKNFVLALNYCLMPGLNDTEEDVQGVADFSKKLGRTLVNLIPYNPGSQPLCRPPSEAEVEAFLNRLRQVGLQAKVRGTKGRSIMAACGQLRSVP